MTIKPLVELLAVKKKQEAKRSINEEIHTQVHLFPFSQPQPSWSESDDFLIQLLTQSLLVCRLINEVLKSLLLYEFDTCKKTLITSSVSSFTVLLYRALAMHSHFLSFFVHSH